MLASAGAAATAPAETAVVVRPATDADLDALLRFTASYYGPRSNQASRGRVEWLVRHSPHARGAGDVLLLATFGAEVVGCHWKMRLPWRIAGERVFVASPHDLVLREQYREATGSRAMVPPGLQLALGVLNRERYGALLGLSPASESIYSRFQCQPVEMVRMQKILSPVGTAIGMAAERLGLSRRLSLPVEPQEWFHDGRSAALLTAPSDGQLQEALGLPYRAQCYPDWDVQTYRWRFFHSMGPRHVLVTLSAAGGVVGRCVFSFGRRRGATMARIVDAAVEDPAMYPTLLQTAEDGMRRLGVDIATNATTCVAAHRCLAERGWKVQLGVSSRFFARPVRPLDLSDLWGGVYDYGFESAFAP